MQTIKKENLVCWQTLNFQLNRCNKPWNHGLLGVRILKIKQGHVILFICNETCVPRQLVFRASWYFYLIMERDILAGKACYDITALYSLEGKPTQHT